MRNSIAYALPIIGQFRNGLRYGTTKKVVALGLLGGSRQGRGNFCFEKTVFLIFSPVSRQNTLMKSQFAPVQPIAGLPSRELALELMRDSDRSAADTGTGETRTLNPIYLYAGHKYGWGRA